MSRNRVLFKGRKNGITIYLEPSSSFSQLKEMLGEKLVDAQEFFSESMTSITFDGKKLNEEEESELISIITENSDIDISFFNGKKDKTTDNIEEIDNEKPQKKDDETVIEDTKTDDEKTKDVKDTKTEEEKQDKKDKKEKNKKNIKEKIKKKVKDAKDNINKDFDPRENESYYHFGSLRSGQEISYDGSVVIIGDVNPGAEVIAKGNVIVMGSLRGLVHAGCLGNEGMFVTALNLDPIQLRIGSIYTYIPQESKEQSGQTPSLAFVEEGKIFVRPLVE